MVVTCGLVLSIQFSALLGQAQRSILCRDADLIKKKGLSIEGKAALGAGACGLYRELKDLLERRIISCVLFLW
jgi:hypothetical protein